MNNNIDLTSEANVPTGAPRFPKRVYKLRIIEEPEFKTSKKGNAMYVFKFECVEPATLMVDGVEREMAGWEFTTWAAYFKSEKTGKVENPTLKAIHTQLGFPLSFNIEPDTGRPAGIVYTGAEVDALCMSEESPMLDETQQPIINPRTGQPLKTYNRRVLNIL